MRWRGAVVVAVSAVPSPGASVCQFRSLKPLPAAPRSALPSEAHGALLQMSVNFCLPLAEKDKVTGVVVLSSTISSFPAAAAIGSDGRAAFFAHRNRNLFGDLMSTE